MTLVAICVTIVADVKSGGVAIIVLAFFHLQGFHQLNLLQRIRAARTNTHHSVVSEILKGENLRQVWSAVVSPSVVKREITLPAKCQSLCRVEYSPDL